MGTVKVDIGSRLNTNRFQANDDIYEVAPVFARAGGTATNFASAANDLFDTVNIVAAIGDDGLTDLLMKGVQAVCSTALLQRCAGLANALVLTVRDAPDPDGRRNRLLVSSDRSPHAYLSPTHILSCRTTIESSDYFVCDGYALQHPTSTEALLTALELAQSAGVCSVLDLVPHNLPSTMPKSHVVQAIKRASIVVAEARTVVGLNDEQWPVNLESDASLIDRAVKASNIIAPSAAWILRYGFENIEHTRMLCTDGTVVDYCTTYRREANRHLYGDKLLVSELYSMLIGNQFKRPIPNRLSGGTASK